MPLRINVQAPWPVLVKGCDNAEFLAGLFRSWGFTTEIEELRVLFPTPTVPVLRGAAHD